MAACLALGCVSAGAQNAALRVSTGVDLTISTVDSTLQGQGGDIVTQVRPSLQLSSRSGRVRGSLDYSLDAIHHSRQYAGNGQADSLQNALNATLSAEAVPNWAYVDAYANISQRALSPFGQQSVDATQVNANRSEVSQVGIKPYVRGVLGGLVSYQVVLSADAMHAKGAAAPDSGTTSVSLSLTPAQGGARFGWSFQANEQHPRSDAAAQLADEDFLRLARRRRQESAHVGREDQALRHPIAAGRQQDQPRGDGAATAATHGESGPISMIERSPECSSTTIRLTRSRVPAIWIRVTTPASCSSRGSSVSSQASLVPSTWVR